MAGETVGGRAEADRIVDRQQQAADVEHRGRADDDPVGAVEPHMPAGRDVRAEVLKLADDGPVERDRTRL